MYISNRLAQSKPSATLAISAMAKSMKQQGLDVISLSAGEPDFATPELIGNAGIAAITTGLTHYTPVPGTVELRTAIANKLARDNNLEFNSNEIIVSNGAKQSIFNTMAATINPGDEVIITAPYWVSYPEMVKLNAGIPVICQPESGIKPNAKNIEKCITKKTKMLIINSPNNPAGYTLDHSTLSEIGQMLADHSNILILSDDIYEYLNWSEQKFCNILMSKPELSNRVIIVNGASKGYAMTGWRIGYTASKNTAINQAMTSYQSQTTSCPSAISQQATIAAMNMSKAELAPMLNKYQARHDILYQGLLKIPGVKVSACEGAFYSFPDFSGYIERLSLKDDIELAKYLLDKAHLAVVPGSAFGMKNHLRLSFATSESNINKALERLNAQI